MDKLKLAHEYAMKHLEGKFYTESEQWRVTQAWEYADMMYAEQEKRTDKTRPVVLEELQVDWSNAPEWANWWAMDKNGVANWYDVAPSIEGIEWVYGRGGDNHSEHKEFQHNINWRNSLQERK